MSVFATCFHSEIYTTQPPYIYIQLRTQIRLHAVV